MVLDLIPVREPIIIAAGEADLRYHPAFLNPSRADALFTQLRHSVDWQSGHLYLHGAERRIPRLFQWYGERDYSYSGRKHRALPLPADLDDLRNLLQKTLGLRFNSVLCNLYRNGKDSVAMHSDDEPELGPCPAIASISLGAVRRFVLRHKSTGERIVLPLEHGSLLLMSGRTQAIYQHGIPKTTVPTGERINLTFRWIQEP
ncbi:MAG: alpha-ketoglutarate-dependent dioxygenase AlkB [Spirochaetales bacterium]|nr:alpha-ketoglutarate-dependent dioxygenase AlkB [Spirochaetales bacterium]